MNTPTELQTTEERLRTVIGIGEVVRIIYLGGSQPGTLREIVPNSIKEGQVWAWCCSSNSVKSFVIDKIEIVDKETISTAKSYNPEVKREKQYTVKSLRWDLEEWQMIENAARILGISPSEVIKELTLETIIKRRYHK